MRLFRYRTPRFLTSAQLHFQGSQDVLAGICTDVSEGGLRALFAEGMPQMGAAGALVLRYPQQEFALGAVVTHLEGKDVGFSFVPRSKEELAAAEHFVQFVRLHAPTLVDSPAR